MNSPLHQFRTEIADGLRQAQRAPDGHGGTPPLPVVQSVPSRPPRAPTSRTSWRSRLGRIARGAGDLLDRTGLETGHRRTLQEGRLRDHASTRAITNGAEVRIVVEAKDRAALDAGGPGRAARGA